ncbi:hypothetical protein BOTBODRAFT_42304 [Botryobasidium botryosum FD-172 SS1]|uniref:Zn(2)-C6 fungal-type domain-containing protein n=1 Tax=Botryobasidium botryosum (strain FD-172 SS1) TaxID=930990 RepID=A0A067N3I8_BOTB1|nr:hypothetical protein BOTBODRAFT_42304 [Botryobasidium botryosum FD-172 SS1]
MPENSSEEEGLTRRVSRGPLKRGNACLNCRKYKRRCDGAKPICGTCIAVAPLQSSCTYDVGPPATRTQKYKDRIQSLECDIKKLEILQKTQAGEDTHSAFTASRSSLTPTASSPSLSNSSSTPSSSPLITTASALVDEGEVTYDPADPYGYIHSLYHDSPYVRPKWMEQEDLPASVKFHLLEIFFQFRHHCQFELYVPRFIESLSLPPGQGPHPALLNVIYALACHFSPSSILSPHEPFFISRTLKALSQSLCHADRLLHFIVASALLARYYAFKGRLLESQAMSGANARFGYALGLHKIPSRIWKRSAGNAHGPYATLLPPPKDPIELGERINVFWALFLNDRAISLGTGSPCAIRDTDIETPWPAPIEAFATGSVIDPETGTLRSVYGPTSSFRAFHARAESVESLKMMGFALLSRARDLASSMNGDIHAFVSINHAISEFVQALPPILRLEDFDDFTLAFTHVLPCAAAIQIFRARAPADPISHQTCVAAAKKALKVIHMHDETDMSQGLSLFALVCRDIYIFLTEEITRLENAKDYLSAAAMRSERDTLLRVSLKLQKLFPVVGLMVAQMKSNDPPPAKASGLIELP